MTPSGGAVTRRGVRLTGRKRYKRN